MVNTSAPTKRQELVLRFIVLYKQKNEMPPTRQEIANHFKWKSVNSVTEHLILLEKKGLIELLHTVRGIKVL